MQASLCSMVNMGTKTLKRSASEDRDKTQFCGRGNVMPRSHQWRHEQMTVRAILLDHVFWGMGLRFLPRNPHGFAPVRGGMGLSCSLRVFPKKSRPLPLTHKVRIPLTLCQSEPSTHSVQSDRAFEKVSTLKLLQMHKQEINSSDF